VARRVLRVQTLQGTDTHSRQRKDSNWTHSHSTNVPFRRNGRRRRILELAWADALRGASSQTGWANPASHSAGGTNSLPLGAADGADGP
jgi:hypothetical protein